METSAIRCQGATSPTRLHVLGHQTDTKCSSIPNEHIQKIPRSEVTLNMSGKFEPKQKVELDPPKDDPISLDYLSKCDGVLLIRSFTACVGRFTDESLEGTHEGYPTYVAIKVD
jgi:hypothetical protein